MAGQWSPKICLSFLSPWPMLVLQPEAANADLLMWMLGVCAQAFVLARLAFLPAETSLHVLIRRTSGLNGYLLKITSENFNKKQKTKYFFSKISWYCLQVLLWFQMTERRKCSLPIINYKTYCLIPPQQ